jgi:hypothetical protein
MVFRRSPVCPYLFGLLSATQLPSILLLGPLWVLYRDISYPIYISFWTNFFWLPPLFTSQTIFSPNGCKWGAPQQEPMWNLLKERAFQWELDHHYPWGVWLVELLCIICVWTWWRVSSGFRICHGTWMNNSTLWGAQGSLYGLGPVAWSYWGRKWMLRSWVGTGVLDFHVSPALSCANPTLNSKPLIAM